MRHCDQQQRVSFLSRVVWVFVRVTGRPHRPSLPWMKDESPKYVGQPCGKLMEMQRTGTNNRLMNGRE
eukprot:scaffold1924_cov140-Skeletonema_menzelii.AAC.3